MAERWQNRIVGEAEVDPATLVPHPLNARRHPLPQVSALNGVLSEVGFVQRIIVNQRTGHILDGHLRAEMAVGRHEPTVPVVYVDLSEDEERLILSVFDPISAMAESDRETLDALLASVTADGALGELLAAMAGAAAPVAFPALPDGDRGAFVTMTFSVTAEQKDAIDEALTLAKRTGLEDAAGANGNGNALAHVAEVYITSMAS